MTTVLNYKSDAIVELMQVPVKQRSKEWLQDSLQQAILLELATIPPYACGLWSIGPEEQSEPVRDAISGIIYDEMCHMGLACNMLTAIGGTPVIAHDLAVPVYPGPLPGGVRPGLEVFLSGLTEESLDMYSKIEEPEKKTAPAEGEAYPSIGAFYSAILESFEAHPDWIQKNTRQVHQGGVGVFKIEKLADVQKAIEKIKEEGEGSAASPDHPDTKTKLAHFYRFREILHGKKLVPVKWDYKGAEIPMPKALRMGRVPEGGWGSHPTSRPDKKTQDVLDEFNKAYSVMLRCLDACWQAKTEKQADDYMYKAIGQMRLLKDPAQKLMKIPLPVQNPLPEPERYGPEFLYVPGDEPGPFGA